MAEQQRTASLNPETFVEGGGLLDDVRAKVIEAGFVTWDYNGNGPETPAAKFVLEIEGAGEGEEPTTQYWSCGKISDWQPSEDGKTLVAVGRANGIVNSSNLGILLKSLFEAGLPLDAISDDISVLEGLEAHWVRTPAPNRKGLAPRERQDGRSFDPTILIVDEITKLPAALGGKKAASKTGATKTASKTTAAKTTASKAKAEPKADAEAGSLEDKAIEVIAEVLTTTGKPVPRSQLASLIFKQYKTDPDRNAIIELTQDDGFLSGDNPLWLFADGNLKLKG